MNPTHDHVWEDLATPGCVQLRQTWARLATAWRKASDRDDWPQNTTDLDQD